MNELLSSTALTQRSDEWLQARIGWVTASRVSDVMAQTKSGGYGASRDNYRHDKINERMTGKAEDGGWQTPAMLRGVQLEPEARETYEFTTQTKVQEVGFVPHPAIEWAGGSPDGLIGNDGMIEIKCPGGAQHWKTLHFGEVKNDYKLQMQFNLACHPGRQWCDFASYYPYSHEMRELRLEVIRFHRDDKLIAKIEDEVRRFLAEIEGELEWARKKCIERRRI